ncbi:MULTISPECIES: adenine deaminase [Clostridium]|uniref:adenine deaminase n=1 Tax=Clostridium TaxID=1485 RepID=UPI0008264931|nr:MULTISPECIES: adenine deaminase [Clostridium]PJI09247.1 adenine deaminase [Clostridium sp. CT7]
MKIKCENKKGLIEAALGEKKSDLVIENVNLVNVFTGEIYKANVGIYKGFISHIDCNPDGLNTNVKKIEAENHYDGHGQYLVPGFIDAHIHIESTMMTPKHFGEAVLPFGTTTVITDPHEIGNVCGIEGVKYMQECGKEAPLREYLLAPSCVPSLVGKENSGAVFTYKEIEELLKMDMVIGLAEVMDFVGVINNDDRISDILQVVEDKGMFIQGHAPFVTGRELSAYLCGGPTTDHESRVNSEAREKMRSGMYVDARESSISKDVAEVVKNINDFRYLTNLTFCTDDKEPAEILETGHMNATVMKAIKCGMNPIDAIRSATLNVAREAGITNLGAIAPGYAADMFLTESLQKIVPSAVFFGGKLAAENGKLKVAPKENKNFKIENTNTMYVNNLSVEDFKIKAPIKDGKIKTNIIKYSSLISAQTDLDVMELPVKDGYINISDNPDLKFIAVINRHKGFNTKGFGIVSGFGTKTGTVASTVAHDCHNLMIVYDTPENAYLAAEDLIKIGGGMCCGKDNKILAHLALPIAGLMSPKPCSELAVEVQNVKNALIDLGINASDDPLLRIATLALPVVPDVKMSDLGMINVFTREIIPMFLK